MSMEKRSDPEQSPRASKVVVMVTGSPGTEGRLVDWSYDANFDPGSSGSNNKDTMKFPYKSGAHRIEFSLTDNTGFGLSFYTDATQAMWAVTGTTCPTGAGDAGGEIQYLSVKDGVLTVINKNKDPGDLCYALRFDGQPQLLVPPYVYDPIMNNGGGGR